MKKRFQLDVDGCVTHEIQLTNITSLAQKLIVNATVEEDGTSAKISTSSDVEIKQFDKSVAQFSIFVRKRHLKPGLPLKGKVCQIIPKFLNVVQFFKIIIIIIFVSFVTDFGKKFGAEFSHSYVFMLSN